MVMNTVLCPTGRRRATLLEPLIHTLGFIPRLLLTTNLNSLLYRSVCCATHNHPLGIPVAREGHILLTQQVVHVLHTEETQPIYLKNEGSLHLQSLTHYSRYERVVSSSEVVFGGAKRKKAKW